MKLLMQLTSQTRRSWGKRINQGSTVIALFTFVHDDTREGSRELIHSLIARGISVEIISGDQQSSLLTLPIVSDTRIAALGELSPEDKVDGLKTVQKVMSQ